MKYMGSKNRISRHILPIMLRRKSLDQFWVEPFVGGGNMIDKIRGNRIGSDFNPYTIQALISIRDHLDELPKNNVEFTEDDYNKLRLDDSYPHKGYAGFTFSFGGKWMGGWSRGCASDGTPRDYVREAYDNAVDQSRYLRGVELRVCSYDELEIPPNSVIYCDPPYAATTEYSTKKFDHEKFWQWCREKTDEGHQVYVSEYEAPDDFDCVWSGGLISNLRRKDPSILEKDERLFVYNKR